MTAAPVLTVLHLNPDSPHVHADSRDLYAMHQRVVSLLALQPGEEKGRELWAQPRPDRLLIQWRRAVDPRWLPDGYALAHQSVPVRLDWQPGQPVRWALVANVIKRNMGRPDVRRARRAVGQSITPRVIPADIGEWTATRLPMLDHRQVECLARRTHTGLQTRTGRKITVVRSRLAGEAVVTDPVGLAAAIRCGVGREKHTGCGLLLVESVGP